MNKFTIDAYNEQAKEYDDQTTDFWDRFPRTFLDYFAKSVSGKKILDVGSGPGRDGIILRELGFDVTCLDASRAMVEIAKSRGMNAVCADFNQMPFDDCSFDAVWAYTSLLHVPKIGVGQSLSEIRRVLKRDGTFGLGMIEGDTEGYIQNDKVTKPRWFSYYTQAEIEALLIEFGFRVTYLEIFKPSSKRYLNFVSTKSNLG